MLKKQGGFTFIDVILAMALVGILGVAIPGALSTANKSTIISNEHTMAESIARSQMDHIQNQPYDSANSTPVYTTLPDVPAAYSVITPMAERLDPIGDSIANDDGLQQITVTVKHGTKIIYTLVDFKVNFNP